MQTLPGHMALALLCLRRSLLSGVVGGQPVPCPVTTLDSCFRSRINLIIGNVGFHTLEQSQQLLQETE
ncbi:hypothetical protein EYF80_005318 [Liparis tanakae]|uniref:Secreted protein n=1 Tax=Liparis tanakae TaxID=230148 RepID=A0A4Z2J1V3_9TELE|nr:hypothetical protein EYF80_005318 [Liparis tanakae]